MKVDLADKYEYIPEWGGNKEDEKPIVFHCRYLTTPERQKCIIERFIDGQLEVMQDDDMIMRYAVEYIENLEDGDSGQKITKGDQLSKVRKLASLVREVASDAVIRNLRPDLKN